jgi:hypothetical protein
LYDGIHHGNPSYQYLMYLYNVEIKNSGINIGIDLE